MKLISFSVRNYRSIETLNFPVLPLPDKSYTYALIGINEAGKSSVLKSLALLDDDTGVKINAQDFQDKNKPVEVEYSYQPEKDEIAEYLQLLEKELPDAKIKKAELNELKFSLSFEHATLTKAMSVSFFNIVDVDLRAQVEKSLLEKVYQNTHFTVYWKSEDKYLISNEILLSQFALDPDNISVPLRRCFELCGYKSKEEISDVVRLISLDSTERAAFRDSLGESVTKLIKKIWPNHPIEISFDISGDTLNFHVRDANTKPKTTNQRSDGFKQFVSFLLTVSSRKELNNLSDTLILLDEPETHLHPQAQEYFLKELIALTEAENNICIFATHSNYMVDKNELSRNYKVTKDEKTASTTVTQFESSYSTYASVNFEVFGILDESYHNELYDLLRERYAQSKGIEVEALGIRPFDDQYFKQEKRLPRGYPEKRSYKVCLPTYVRNCIHYPSNKKADFESRLKESITLLKSYL